MTAFDKWWAECVQRRPALLDESANFKMSVTQLKANLKRAFDAGWAKAKGEPTYPARGPFDKLFGDIFG